MSTVSVTPDEPHTLQTRGITLLRASHREVRRLKRANHLPSLHGNKVWNSSFLIMDHLQENPLRPGQHLMDIGCGWGPLSVFAAHQFGCRVTGVDADQDVFPYLQLLSDINQVQVMPLKARFQQLTQARLGDVDMITGADICFWDELVPVLYNLIRRALRAGVEQIIIADPGRSPFYALAERCEGRLNAEVIERNSTDPKSISADLLVIRH